MKRHFYLSHNLDDMEAVEQKLESEGIDRAQIHVLSNDAAGVDQHHLNYLESLLRGDVIRSTIIGLIIGIFVAAIPILVAYFVGLSESFYWVPVIFLSIVLLGFCTWEGGFIGFQEPHHDYKKFEHALETGKHVLILDVDNSEEEQVAQILKQFRNVHAAGTGDATPGWIVGMRKQWSKFIRWAP